MVHSPTKERDTKRGGFMKTTSSISQVTDFTRDSLGRYICNGLDEALKSAPQSAQNPIGTTRLDARDFDLIVLGGGTFGAALAEHMWFRDKARYHRILVLEAGPFRLRRTLGAASVLFMR